MPILVLENMRIITLIALLILSFCAQAELFKWVDAEGNIIYSDQPPPGIEKEKHQVDEKTLPPIITTPALETNTAPLATGNASFTKSKERYKSVNIVAPEHDTAVRQNAGNVSIKVAIDPYLFNERGDLLVIYMDGLEVSRGNASTVQLLEVDRGTHTVRAEIIGENGKILKKASPVSFTLLRHSRLFNTN